MDDQELKDRTQQLAARIVRLVDALPQARSSQVIGERLMQSAAMVGAKARAVMHITTKAGKSDVYNTVKESADEALFWLELIIDAEIMSESRLEGLISEVNEIIALTTVATKPQRGKKS